MISDSAELCETEVCFLHIQLIGTNVWLSKMHNVPLDVDFEPSRSLCKIGVFSTMYISALCAKSRPTSSPLCRGLHHQLSACFHVGVPAHNPTKLFQNGTVRHEKLFVVRFYLGERQNPGWPAALASSFDVKAVKTIQ